MSWVNPDELTTFLQAAKLMSLTSDTLDALLPLQQALDAAQEEFERRVKWLPFLMDTEDVARRFDADGQEVLDFGAGLLSLTSVTVYGDVWERDTQFWLGPDANPVRGKPYMFLEWLYSPTPILSVRRQIVITGKWGRVTEITSGVKQILLAGAAHKLYPALALRISEGLVKRTGGDESEDFARGVGTGPLVEEAGAWAAQFEAGIAAWMLRRVV